MPSIWRACQGGKLRALGVASLAAHPAAPELPAISETLPGFDVTSWEGILAPAGTPAPVVAKIADEIRRIAREPQFVKSMLDLGAVAASNTPAGICRIHQQRLCEMAAGGEEAGIKVE